MLNVVLPVPKALEGAIGGGLAADALLLLAAAACACAADAMRLASAVSFLAEARSVCKAATVC